MKMEKNTHTYNIHDETEVQDNRGNLDEKNEQNIRFFLWMLKIGNLIWFQFMRYSPVCFIHLLQNRTYLFYRNDLV